MGLYDAGMTAATVGERDKCEFAVDARQIATKWF